MNENEIGLSTEIGRLTIEIPQPVSNNMATMDNTYGATDPNHNPTNIITEAVKTKSSNYTQSDRRVSPRAVSSGGAGARGTAAFMLAIDAFYVAYDIFTAYWIVSDLNGIDKDKELLGKAFEALKFGRRNGLIPPKYQNPEDLSIILNFVFQGVNDTGNEDITNIGTNILNEVGKYDEKKIKSTIKE